MSTEIMYADLSAGHLVTLLTEGVQEGRRVGVCVTSCARDCEKEEKERTGLGDVCRILILAG